MSKETSATVRPLDPEDLQRVVEIDHSITGRSRRGFFEKRLAAAVAGIDPFIVVATERDGALTGFAIARVESGEFGDAVPVATLDAIGGDPECQGSGHGTLLIQGIVERMAKLGIGELRTQANWDDHGLMRFFATHGFALAPRQVLERPVTRTQAPGIAGKEVRR